MAPASYDSVLAAVYAAAADPADWPRALTALSDHLGAQGVILVHNAPAGCRSSVVQVRSRDDLAETYLRHHTDNAWTRAIAPLAVGTVHVAGQFVTQRELRRTACYADILQPQGIVEMLVLPHARFARRGGTGGFGISLDARGAETVLDKAAALERLAPHLTRAFDLSIACAEARSAGQGGAGLLEAWPTAALILDERGGVAQANAAAEALLSAGDGIATERGPLRRLTAALPVHRRALDRALAAALAAAAGEEAALSTAIALTRASGAPPLALIVTPLRQDGALPWPGLRPGRLLVSIADPCLAPGAAEALLRQGFGLTPAEARVAALVASGSSGPQAAARLGLSPETVKRHLSRILSKTGSRTQSDLARLAGRLPRL